MDDDSFATTNPPAAAAAPWVWGVSPSILCLIEFTFHFVVFLFGTAELLDDFFA